MIVKTQNFRLSKKFTSKSYFFKVKEKSSFSILYVKVIWVDFFGTVLIDLNSEKNLACLVPQLNFLKKNCMFFFWNFLNLEGKRPQNDSKKINFF